MMRPLAMLVEAMTDGRCVGAVWAVVNSVPGARVVGASLGWVVLDFDPDTTTPAAIAQAVHDAGYPARVVGGQDGHDLPGQSSHAVHAEAETKISWRHGGGA